MGFTEYFDLHCDTPLRMCRAAADFNDDALDVRLSDLAAFSGACQVCAVWSDPKKSGEENYAEFLRTAAYFQNEAASHSADCKVTFTRTALFRPFPPVKLILAVEGASLLCGRISRLETLYALGVRVLTFAWRGENEACGAHDTDKGLTPFGYELLEACERLGIVVDVSHLSDRGFWEIARAAKKPFIASHSNARALCRSSRNLTDEQFLAVVGCGGIVGVNLYPPFLSADFEKGNGSPDAYLSAFCRHVEHFLSLSDGGVSFGGDRDGFERIPFYSRLSTRQAAAVFEKLAADGITEKQIAAVFSENARRFFGQALKDEKDEKDEKGEKDEKDKTRNCPARYADK